MSRKKINNQISDFALVWSLIFIVVGLYPVLYNENIRIWAVALSIGFMITALIKPAILLIFYKTWVKFGEFMGGIISKIIMFILYFGLFTPVSIFLKILGKDLLSKKVDKSKYSYWVNRKDQPQSMKNQF